MRTAFLAIFALAACYGPLPAAPAPPEPPPPAVDPEADLPPDPEVPFAFLVSSLSFTREDPPGIAPGFDLDGVVSDGTDAGSCHQLDLTSPEGTPGVDNQLTALVPALEEFGGDAVENLVNAAIADGAVLILLGLDGVDDPEDDPKVGLRVSAGLGKPLLGTDGRPLPGQTFGEDTAAPVSETPAARLDGRTLEAGPFELTIPIVVFGITYVLDLHGAVLHATLTEDRYLAGGVLAGGLDVETIVSIAAGADAQIPEVFFEVVPALADLDPGPDGACTRLSAVLRFEAVPAFLYTP